jgi:hypothetical protein
VTIFILTAEFSFSQDGNIVYVQTWEFQMPEGGSWAEFDSLATLLNENVTKKNPKIVSQRIIRHQWGSDSRQLIIIREYAKIEDLVLDDDNTGNELFRAHWKTDEERKAFNQAFRKYWRGYHSDEIYQEFSGARK